MQLNLALDLRKAVLILGFKAALARLSFWQARFSARIKDGFLRKGSFNLRA